ncbi:SAVED domain-containing protein [Myxococcota bacterium]|nr:SAVED domain-containing protein [Myxococcota bacterium]
MTPLASPTDPCGRVFLSYRRTQARAIATVAAALRDHGVPIWQDVDDLGAGPSEGQIRDCLADPRTSGALLWITPDVEGSDFVLGTEVPVAVSRMAADDGFFVFVAAAGVLSEREAAEIASRRLGIRTLHNHNVFRVAGEPTDPAVAGDVAARVLRQRLSTLHGRAPAGAPVELRFDTRMSRGPSHDVWVAMDWHPRFGGRPVNPEIWDGPLAALSTVTDAIAREAPGRSVHARGLLAIGAALALGVRFLAPGGRDLTWFQYSERRPEQPWRLDAAPEGADFRVHHHDGDVDSRELAVALSVTSSVEEALSQSRPALPRFRGVVEVSAPGPYPHDLATPGEAARLAYTVRDAIRAGRERWRHSGPVHLFMSGPVGLAVLLGQLLNTLETVQTYELVRIAGDRQVYVPAARLHPSS